MRREPETTPLCRIATKIPVPNTKAPGPSAQRRSTRGSNMLPKLACALALGPTDLIIKKRFSSSDLVGNGVAVGRPRLSMLKFFLEIRRTQSNIEISFFGVANTYMDLLGTSEWDPIQSI